MTEKASKEKSFAKREVKEATSDLKYHVYLKSFERDHLELLWFT